jgi:hypothetical protein
MISTDSIADETDKLLVWGAHAPRVLVSAARRNAWSWLRADEKSAQFCVTRLPKNGKIPDDLS